MHKVRDERGIALLATMLAIAMMTIIVVDFTSSSAMGYLSAANHANEIRAEYLARSGINVGLALLAQDTRTQLAQQQSNASGLGGQGQPFDSFLSVWALPFPPMPVNGGRVQLAVVDEARKFNINRLINTVQINGLTPTQPGAQSSPLGTAPPVSSTPYGTSPSVGQANANGQSTVGQINPNAVLQLTRLVMLLGISPAIIPPIVDWLDPDSIDSPGGAESDYYLQLMPPYEPRNHADNASFEEDCGELWPRAGSPHSKAQTLAKRTTFFIEPPHGLKSICLGRKIAEGVSATKRSSFVLPGLPAPSGTRNLLPAPHNR